MVSNGQNVGEHMGTSECILYVTKGEGVQHVYSEEDASLLEMLDSENSML